MVLRSRRAPARLLYDHAADLEPKPAASSSLGRPAQQKDKHPQNLQRMKVGLQFYVLEEEVVSEEPYVKKTKQLPKRPQVYE